MVQGGFGERGDVFKGAEAVQDAGQESFEFVQVFFFLVFERYAGDVALQLRGAELHWRGGEEGALFVGRHAAWAGADGERVGRAVAGEVVLRFGEKGGEVSHGRGGGFVSTGCVFARRFVF